VLIERYKSGEVIKKLSEDYGVCFGTIRRYLRNAKIPKMPFRRISRIHLDYKEVRQLYIDQRLSIEKIASVYGTSFSFIQKVLRDDGIPIRRNKITPKQLEEIAKRHQNGETVINLANEFGVSD